MKEAKVQTEIFAATRFACLSVEELTINLEYTRRVLVRSLAGMVLRGIVERREKGCYAATKFGLDLLEKHGFIPFGSPTTKKASRAAVRGTLRQRAWNVMRIQSPFTVRGVAALASKERSGAEHSLYKWFSALEAAGYIQREARRDTSNDHTGNGLLRFRLVQNTGMIAPIHSVEHGCIRDPNTGKDAPCTK